MLCRFGQTQPAKKVPKVIRQNEQRQSHPVGHELMARQPSPVQGVLALLDPSPPEPGDEAMPPSLIQTRAMASYNFILLEWDIAEGRDINNYRPQQGLERRLI